MTRSVITICSDLDAHDAAQIMVDHKIGALPVIDDRQLVGIVTETDLLRRVREGRRRVARAARLIGENRMASARVLVVEDEADLVATYE